jgi:hypothetical protein
VFDSGADAADVCSASLCCVVQQVRAAGTAVELWLAGRDYCVNSMANVHVLLIPAVTCCSYR